MQQKKIVTAGDRVYLKFFDMDFFHQKAAEANAKLVPFKELRDIPKTQWGEGGKLCSELYPD